MSAAPCKDCGVLVGDWRKHRAWHERLRDAVMHPSRLDREATR